MPMIDIFGDGEYILQYWNNISWIRFDTKTGTATLHRSVKEVQKDNSLSIIVMKITGITDIDTEDFRSLASVGYFHDGLLYITALTGHNRPFDVYIDQLQDGLCSMKRDCVFLRITYRGGVVARYPDLLLSDFVMDSILGAYNK